MISVINIKVVKGMICFNCYSDFFQQYQNLSVKNAVFVIIAETSHVLIMIFGIAYKGLNETQLKYYQVGV